MSLESLKTLFVDTLVVQALPVTLQLILGAFIGACIIGLAGGIIRGLKIPVLDQILGVYAQLCRGIPDMLVLLFLYRRGPERRPLLVRWGLIAGGSGLLFLLAGMVSSALEVFFTLTAALLTRRIWLTAGERQEKF